jgi:hypothetical protein
MINHQPFVISGKAKWNDSIGELLTIGEGGVLIRSSSVPLVGVRLRVELLPQGCLEAFFVTGIVVASFGDIFALTFQHRIDNLAEFLAELKRTIDPIPLPNRSSRFEPAGPGMLARAERLVAEVVRNRA